MTQLRACDQPTMSQTKIPMVQVRNSLANGGDYYLMESPFWLRVNINQWVSRKPIWHTSWPLQREYQNMAQRRKSSFGQLVYLSSLQTIKRCLSLIPPSCFVLKTPTILRFRLKLNQNLQSYQHEFPESGQKSSKSKTNQTDPHQNPSLNPLLHQNKQKKQLNLLDRA